MVGENGEPMVVYHQTDSTKCRKNRVHSVFPKDYGEWQNWINNGKATNIDKEKALECLGALRNHHETELTEQELSLVENIVKGFKT